MSEDLDTNNISHLIEKYVFEPWPAPDSQRYAGKTRERERERDMMLSNNVTNKQTDWTFG